jgi:ABC-type multidrug transport system ATPase subunit
VAPASARSEVAAHPASDVVRIGRHDDNDIVLPDLRASRFHAEVRRTGDAYRVVDLGSSNGVNVNGKPVVKSAPLSTGDRVSIGRHDLVFDGQRLHEYIDTGPASLFADDLSVQIGKQTLLDDVSFAVREGALVGIIGPSGCGKSTLMKAITGLRPANQGHVQYDGRDLYEEYTDLRYRIGLVPQDDVLHRQLTVRRALRFAASLRFADDVPRRDRAERVDEVLAMLGLSERAKQRISTLSGGQRKRVSVALELLTEPSLLCLDEPTSGLDPALDREVMRELRNLADRGRTVVVVTHSVLHLAMCDRVLVMCLGGRMGFFGPPEEVLDFFGASDYADVFEMVTNDAAAWSVRYRNSEQYRRHVGEVVLQLTAGPSPVPQQRDAVDDQADSLVAEPPTSDPAPTSEPAPASERSTASGPPSVAPDAAGTPAGPEAGTPPGAAPAGRPRTGKRNPVAPIRQLVTLSARMIAVIASDRGYVLFLLGLPLALALLTHSVPGHKGLGPDTTFTLEAQRLLVVLIVGASFLGLAIPIREIVSEGPIYARERAVGISPGAYLGSKLVVFFVLDVLQVTLFVWLALLGRPKEATPLIFHSMPLLEVIIPVAGVAFVSTILGLLVSALVKTVEQTTPVLVVSVMAQLVLSGGLFILAGEKVLEQVSWLSPTRWGFSAGASSVNLLATLPPFATDPMWVHAASAWWRAMVWLLVQAVVLAGLAYVALRRHDPGRKD